VSSCFSDHGDVGDSGGLGDNALAVLRVYAVKVGFPITRDVGDDARFRR